MEGPQKTRLWRAFMFFLALFNVTVFLYLRAAGGGAKSTWYSETMRMLAFPYVFQTSWRCIFISEYPHRYTITDSPLNSVLVARLLAALGEFCFGVQLCLALQALTTPGQETPGLAGMAIIILDGIGQCCATFGTLAGSHFPFLLEGVIWTTLFGIIQVMTITSKAISTQMTALIFLATGPAMLYMIVSYCPMCWTQWKEEQQARTKKETAKSFRTSAWEALTMRVATQDWAVWQHEVAWQSLYFSFGTWTCMYLMVAPLQRDDFGSLGSRDVM